MSDQEEGLGLVFPDCVIRDWEPDNRHSLVRAATDAIRRDRSGGRNWVTKYRDRALFKLASNGEGRIPTTYEEALAVTKRWVRIGG